MNPWPFVIAAYSVTVIAIVSLAWWAHTSTRRAEAAADKLRRE